MATTPYRTSADPISSMFEDFLRPAASLGGRMGGLMRTPDADVMETEIRVMAELPGMKPEDIELLVLAEREYCWIALKSELLILISSVGH